MKLGAFSFLERRHCNGTPIKAWNIAALHWRWSITWRWFLEWAPWSDTSDPRPLRWSFYRNGGGFMALGLPVIGSFYFAWQRNMRRKQCDGDNGGSR